MRYLFVLLLSMLLPSFATAQAYDPSLGAGWTWPGDLREHMQEHGVTDDGTATTEQMIAWHDHIHDHKGQGAVGTPDSTDAKTYLASCPGGNCPPGFGIGGGIYIGPTRPPQQARPQPRQEHPCILHVTAKLPDSTLRIGSSCVIGQSKAHSFILTCSHYCQTSVAATFSVGYGGVQVPCEVIYRHDADDVMILKCRSLHGGKFFPIAAEPPGNGASIVAMSILNGSVQSQKGWVAKTVVDSGGKRTINGNNYYTNIVFVSGQSGGVALVDGRVVGVISGSDGKESVLVSWDAIYAAVKACGWLRDGKPIADTRPAQPPPAKPDPQPTPASNITIIRGEMHQLSVDIKAQIAAIPHGPRGETGPAGPPGADGKSVTALELQAAVAAWMKAHPGQSVDLQPLLDRIAALEERGQRVILVDGERGTVLDDETYTAGEPIVLDIRRISTNR